MWWGYPWSWAMGLWMVFWGIFWVVVIVLAIWALVRWVGQRQPGQPGQPGQGPVGGPSAMEILRQRYARGEIDATTFEQMRERLEATQGPTHDPNAPIPSGM